MALIVEDGTGKADAESPNSVSELDAYHSKMGNAGWTGSGTIKEQAARRASKFMEARFGTRLPGIRRLSTQALSYPRVDSYRMVGSTAEYAINYNEVPIEWKDAHAVLSLRTLTVALAPDVTRLSRVSSVAVEGAVSVSWEAGSLIETTFREAEDALKPLLRSGAVLIRG